MTAPITPDPVALGHERLTVARLGTLAARETDRDLVALRALVTEVERLREDQTQRLARALFAVDSKHHFHEGQDGLPHCACGFVGNTHASAHRPSTSPPPSLRSTTMTDPITPDERAEWRALADAATEGPWRRGWYAGVVEPKSRLMTAHDGYNHCLAEYLTEADAEFIAAARTAVPRLLDALDAAEAEVARLSAAFETVQASAHEAAQAAKAWEAQAHKALDQRDEARAKAERLRAAVSPAWDEDTVRAEAKDAITALESDYDFESGHFPDEDAYAGAVLAVVRRHLPVSGESRAQVQAEALAPIRAALHAHPRCDVHPDGEVPACGWKRAVADVQAALDGDHRALQAIRSDAWDEGHEAGTINTHEHRPGRRMTNPYREEVDRG